MSRKAATPDTALARDAFVGHSCRSRTRLCLPDLKGKAAELTAVCDGLMKLKGVRQVDGRPLTGSLIVLHDGSIDDLAREARKAALFNIKESVAEAHELHRDAEAWKETVDRVLGGAVGHGFDARSIGALAFAAIALRQLASGHVMPLAATALWYALNLIAPAPSRGTPPDGGGGE